MRNEVQLITYVDRFGGQTLTELQELLAGPLNGAFGGVHLLPFFYKIDGADAGFDPIDHTRVDDRLGDWNDVRKLSNNIAVMADVIVNHMSSASPQFLDYSQKGSASEYDGLFLTMDAVFPDGATEKDLLAVYRPRPGMPFTVTTLANGERRLLWTTFTPQQIDIDVQTPVGQAYLESILQKLSQSGVTMVRLDAVGYAIKKAGTNCFMMPETFDFIKAFAQRGRELGLEVLVEIHSYYKRQMEIAKQVDWVYDFALPPLVLHALEFGRSGPLMNWLAQRPNNAVTVLDTHDGIGIIDIGADAADRVNNPGLVPPEELDELVERMHHNSQGQSRQATGAAASNLDLYQVNCTFFDALGRNEAAYLVARAIQFFVPGIPQVYYVGLLAGENDMELLAKTQVGRDINRHYYSREEVLGDLNKPVVQRLIDLMRFRNAHLAFAGTFESAAPATHLLTLSWRHQTAYARLEVDLLDKSGRIIASAEDGGPEWLFELK
ncbi:sucrose phosphorylase [Limnohabitans sp. Bal53]|uniref:sucrose phosphorylase n=1 Tax=Limnohabitans sp. Bal53 TaxID=1977910 RepID=UPI000D34DD9C|nr:sucrose phosphorylase [Limnohabitans sp. Bal53]PUE38485.1 sucrose phosphorylase [Limnohabitans sp. Bal53]